jgi:hypothetical protein
MLLVAGLVTLYLVVRPLPSFIDARRRLKSHDETIKMLGDDVNQMVLAQRDMIEREVEFFKNMWVYDASLYGGFFALFIVGTVLFVNLGVIK